VGKATAQRTEPPEELVNWKKVAEALFSDITSSPAGKRLLLRILRSQHSHIRVHQRDFCRLPRNFEAVLSTRIRGRGL
jgi:hypothetical protein